MFDHIGITGTRAGLTGGQARAATQLIDVLINGLGYSVLHEGDCIGADAQINRLWREFGGKVYSHPPTTETCRAYSQFDWEAEPKDYLIRNKDIVNSCRLLLAFPRLDHEELRSGTWHAIRYAKKIHRPITIFWPNGNMETIIE